MTLDELKRLEEAATKGSWLVAIDEDDAGEACLCNAIGVIADPLPTKDAAFIAAMRNAAPWHRTGAAIQSETPQLVPSVPSSTH